MKLSRKEYFAELFYHGSYTWHLPFPSCLYLFFVVVVVFFLHFDHVSSLLRTRSDPGISFVCSYGTSTEG